MFELDGDPLFQDDGELNAENDEDAGHVVIPCERRVATAVHQCNVCNKLFVSLKGLQQHAIVHTGERPYTCEVCNKSFRFKSNLFEHRSVHTGFIPYSCTYCGKNVRLKGNLKKHLKTHTKNDEEFQAAWSPFSSARRPKAEIHPNASVIRSSLLVTPRLHSRKPQLNVALRNSIDQWIDRIRLMLIPERPLVDRHEVSPVFFY